MSTAFTVVTVIIFVVALAFLLFYGWHLWRIWLERRRHTRERFLLLAFRAIVAAFLAYLGYLFAGTWGIQLLVNGASGTYVDFSANPNEPDAIAVIGATVVLLALLAFTYFAFRYWPGPSSEFQRRNPDRATIELILGLLTDRDQRRLMLQPGQEPTSPSLDAAPPAPPGHLRAMKLIMAHDPQYQVRAEDWHPEEQAFLGSYGSEAQPFVFFYKEHLDSGSARLLRDHVDRHYAAHRKRAIAESLDPAARTELPSDLEVLTFDAILDDRARLRSYERALQERLTRRRFGADSPSIADMLVPIAGGTSPGGGEIANLLNYVVDWTQNGLYNRHLALLGEYGQGKSVFAITLALELLRRFDEFRRVPILIELGGKSPRTTPLQALLNDWAGAYAVGSSRAQAWLEAGRAVLIFDAFDEMDLVGDRTLRLQNFLSLWQGTWHPGTRIIITGRPNLFLDTGEMREALRLTTEASIDHHAQPVYLQKFDRGRIEAALAPWPISVKQGILAAYDRGHGLGTFRELIERPSTLALAASVWTSIEAEVEAGRVGNSAIIRQFLYATYARQRQKREREEAKPLLTTPELAFFMRAAAAFMAERHGATNRIARSELADLVGQLLESWPTSLARLGNLPAEQQADRQSADLADWVKDNRNRAEAVRLEVAATGMLVDDPADQAFLRMAHKSFFEYLTAEVLVLTKFPERFSALVV